MKQLSIIILALATCWLAGCTVEEIKNDNNKPLPEGVTRLSATIASDAKTRAVGDPLTDATVNEKRIDRIAFFVHTEAEGMQVYPPLGTGETSTDFPNKVALTSNPDGSYSATVDLMAGAGYDADIVAIANLPADYDYGQIVTWKGLLDSVTYAVNPPEMPTVTDASGGKAFIMQGNTTVALHKEKEEKFSLTMERLVARIDITNMAYSGDPKSGFSLSSARILQAMPGSYLYPHDLYTSPNMQTVTSPSWSFDDTAVKYYMGEVEDANDKTTEVGGGDPTAADRQAVWHNLYTYENSDTQHAPTAVEISGTFRGNPITRRIPFEAVQPDGITKKPVPIVRNHRYLLLIKPAPGLTDIAYELKVADWNAVDTINVQPNQDQVPVVTNTVCAEATNSYGGDLAGKVMPDTLVVPATGATLTFTAACPFDTKVTFGYANGGDEQGWLSATSTEATLVPATKASTKLTYQREYTVTVKNTNTLKDAYVNRGYIYIANGGNGSIVDTVTVYQGKQIAYGETRLAAVLYKGQLWAPVNVGATEVPTKVEAPWDVKTCGYYYQWGRNVPFKLNGNDVAPDGTCPTYEEGTAPGYQYADKFIKMSNNISWFSDNKSPSLSPALTGLEWPRKNQPCPTGWRVPTKDELQKIADEMDATNTYIVNGIWKSTENPLFVLPAAESVPRSSGNNNDYSAYNGSYWPSTFNTTGRCYSLIITNSIGGLLEDFPGSGYSIRCVQE